MMELHTDRLILREFVAGDWPAVLAYQRDPRYLRLYEWEDRAEEDVRAFVNRFVEQQAPRPRTRYQLAITRRDDGRLIGNAGIRLIYPVTAGDLPGLKDGILLEVGFDDTAPNAPCTISSWALDAALQANMAVIDNRAVGVYCYSPAYTFVEKLQTVSTKFRLQQEATRFPKNFLRHYYDIYCLLASPEVQAFIGTPTYHARKVERFRAFRFETDLAPGIRIP